MEQQQSVYVLWSIYGNNKFEKKKVFHRKLCNSTNDEEFSLSHTFCLLFSSTHLWFIEGILMFHNTLRAHKNYEFKFIHCMILLLVFVFCLWCRVLFEMAFSAFRVCKVQFLSGFYANERRILLFSGFFMSTHVFTTKA